jgi:hypothetical protein
MNFSVRDVIFFIVGVFTGFCLGLGIKFAFKLLTDLIKNFFEGGKK